uniref:Uncharacterized protein n=1 Tax=Anopheles farauti TaxID=69004 RepID=A0A182QKA8_9DIPT
MPVVRRGWWYVLHFGVDKSNSVAHLVENEVPLSTTGNVSILSGGGGVEDTTTTTVLLDEDGMELETRVKGPDDGSNQLTGSYTNLFRDALAAPGQNGGPSGYQGKMNYHTSMMMSDCDKIQSADEIINVSELMMVCSVSGHENVYSNVPTAQISPSGSAVGLLSPKRASLGSSNVSAVVDVSTPIVGSGPSGHQQHVYSNVTGNDLDLDDPVLSSSFATAKSLNGTVKASSGSTGASSQQHLKQSQPPIISTLEMKNVIKTLDPSVIIHQTAAVNGGGSSSAVPNNNTQSSTTTNGESPMFISPSASRMRLLQESTMIDTALDLDSLDGSIGNHSQSCLVKTAIV